MQKAVKLVPVVVLLIASTSLLAQERTVGTEPKPSAKKTMTIASNSDQPTPAAERVASAAQIQALERSIEELRQEIAELRQELENNPHYLDQNDHPLWP